MREVEEYIGSLVQDRGHSEGAPKGQLRDQNEGGRGSPRFQMGGPVVGEWAQSAHYTQPIMSVIVTRDLGHHNHSKLRVVLLSCPHYLDWVWAT